MRRKTFLAGFLLVFAIELIALVLFAVQEPELEQDVVAVNMVVHSVQDDWENLETHVNQTKIDYVVLDPDGVVRFRTREGLSETIHEATRHRDTILDLRDGEDVVGKLILFNDSASTWQAGKEHMVIVLAAGLVLQGLLCIGYLCYLECVVIRPFSKLQDFAVRVAGGNLDIPLAMDRGNLFGAFTESFDLMRSELKRARLAETQANESRKELVAKLSHDIRTPIASIRAASELGAALAAATPIDAKEGARQNRDSVMAEGDAANGKFTRIRENYEQILYKTDQISALVNGLFTATLEELQQLPVSPVDVESQEIVEMLRGADYLHRAVIPEAPECLICADRLRLQQVFDNIFSNAYKYAPNLCGKNPQLHIENGGNGESKTRISKIDVAIYYSDAFLAVAIEDYGRGVAEEELPRLKEKFWRGSNCAGAEGAGLGLYISDYFMKKMQGELVIKNGEHGLLVIVRISMSGR